MLEARQGFGEEVRDVFLAGHMLNAELPMEVQDSVLRIA